jgi:hypothetical protein
VAFFIIIIIIIIITKTNQTYFSHLSIFMHMLCRRKFKEQLQAFDSILLASLPPAAIFAMAPFKP